MPSVILLLPLRANQPEGSGPLAPILSLQFTMCYKSYKRGGLPPYISSKCRLARVKTKGKRTLIIWCLAILLAIMFILALVLGLVLGLAHRSKADINLTVDLDYAKYQGVNEDGGISHWWGIRYAAPPVGDFRFRAPQPPATNATLQNADTVGLTLQLQLHQLTSHSTGRYVTAPLRHLWRPTMMKTACFLTSMHLPNLLIPCLSSSGFHQVDSTL